MSDPTGEIPFLLLTAAVGAVVGAVVGGVVAAKNGKNVWAGIGIGAAAGALVGLGAGAAAGVLLAGSATASTTAVAGGAAALATAVTTGGIGAGASYLSQNISNAVNSGTVQNAASATYPTQNVSGSGYATFSQLKGSLGSPGVGNQWHHIVEQCQIMKSGFSAQMIQNTSNVVAINTDVHRMISGYYSSIQPFTGGLTVRNWLVGQSFAEQYSFGVEVIKMFTE